jgi:hypothetical protein
MSAGCPRTRHSVRDVPDLIVRELRLRPFTDTATAPIHPSAKSTAETPGAPSASEALARLSARHSRRRAVDEREL